jgi:hypothetical protein
MIFNIKSEAGIVMGQGGTGETGSIRLCRFGLLAPE